MWVKNSAFTVASLVLAATVSAQTVTPSQGLVITKSGKLRAGEYLIPSAGNERGPAAIVVKGNNLTVDLSGVVLRGTPASVQPSERKGVGIEVIGNNVTIKNAKIHGYKVALIARNAQNLKVLDSDFSYNWKQHLRSTLEREDVADWMSYHQNEKDEWLRFGGGIYLRGCNGFEIKGNTVRGGQNGLMITSSNKGLVWNNDFSFNSSLGMGLYRSSENRVMHNRMDWNVRGFSYGVYNRGQDSAGILIYEQSHKNIFAYNSVTHGGDGFFLWAGQTTMDTGKGGANDNLLYGNDWSHAPTNGIEATFSRNNFVNNLILECWHGIWGGYSFESKVIGNVFGYNSEAIAWEHGQDNLVQGNRFIRDNEAFVIWSNPTQDPNWGYAKLRDTRSRDWKIVDNVIENTFANAIRIRRTAGVDVTNNRFEKVGKLIDVGPEVTGLRFSQNRISTPNQPTFDAAGVTNDRNQVQVGPSFAPLPQASALNQGDVSNQAAYLARFDVPWTPYPTGNPANKLHEAYAPKPLRGGINPFLKKGTLRGWRYMIVDEWGPYDFQRPILWQREELPAASTDAPRVRRFEILGPKGNWTLANANGVKLSAQSGTVPGFVDVTFESSKATNVNLELQYTGGRVVDHRGVVTPAGSPVKFGYSRFFAPIDWTVKFFEWTKSVDASNPLAAPDPEHYKEVISGKPVVEVKTDRLDYMTGGSFVPGAPANKFATVADGTFEIDPGTYTLDVTTDDGIRIWVDDQLVLESWKYQGPTPYQKELKLGGKHKIRVEHFEIDGYAALQIKLLPK